MSNGKVMIIHLIVGLKKRYTYIKMRCFQKLHTNNNKIS